MPRSTEPPNGASRNLSGRSSVPQHRRPNADHSLYAGLLLDAAATRRAQSSQCQSSAPAVQHLFEPMRSPVRQGSNSSDRGDRRNCRIAPIC